MRLTDILQSDCVKAPLSATSKQDAIHELVDVMAAALGLNAEHTEGLKQAVWAREMTRTTGIGHGIGIPHGKAAGIESLAMAVGKTAEPIEFGAIDRKPVELIFLLASPIDQTGPHIQALAGISRMLTDTEFRGLMMQAEGNEAVYGLIVEHEAKQAVG